MTGQVTSRKGGFRRARRPRTGLWCAAAIALLVVGYAFVLVNSTPHVSGDRLRIDTFVLLANKGQIKEARVLNQDSFVVGRYVRDDGSVGRYSTPFLETSGPGLVDTLVKASVPTTIDQQTAKGLLDPATLLFPALIVVVLLVYLIISHRRGTGLFGIRSGARRVDGGGATATFADVAGQDGAITELAEVRDFLTDPARFTALGARIPKGILLFGPPGCGKTLLARAVAGEAGAAFFTIAGSDFVELYQGVGAARVRDLFKQARQHAPAIVFIDELDSVGRRRGGKTADAGSNGEQEQALNQILAELDGFSPLEGIIVIAATNRPDVLDPALLRPGRFDRSIGLERPDEKGRHAVLSLHARRKPLADDVDLADLAGRAVGLSGADLAGVMNDGALLAARGGRSEIVSADLDAALQRVVEDPERQRRLSMRDRSFSRSAGGPTRVTFADVAGLDEAVAELAEVRDYLAQPERFARMGARPPRGFLLVGAPGCGKTLLARAVANEANVAFFSVAATQFVEVFAGEGAARVRDLFAEARSVAPAIVFLDEVDAIGARRGVVAEGQREREQTLNQILIELDGFDAGSGVIVMAASNRPEILDEALVRPGRFDRTVMIGLPDRAARAAILALHAEGTPFGPDVDFSVVAGITQGFSGADLANVVNEAALLATRQGLDRVPMSVIEEAVERVGTGVAKTRVLTAEDRKVVAYHEAGHALVGLALPGASTPHRISIVARGQALGTAWHHDEVDRLLHSRSALLDRMAGLLGGRAAEELVFGEPGSGASDDLARVGDLARQMVCQLGMSPTLGPLSYPPGGHDGNGHSTGYSQQAAGQIDTEVRRLVDEAYHRAAAVLGSSRATLDRAAAALLEHETITGDDLAALAGSNHAGVRSGS